MKLYVIKYVTYGSDKERQEWVGTQLDAKRRYKELCDEHQRFNVDQPVVVEVPTAKPALLDWLNKQGESK